MTTDPLARLPCAFGRLLVRLCRERNGMSKRLQTPQD